MYQANCRFQTCIKPAFSDTPRFTEPLYPSQKFGPVHIWLHIYRALSVISYIAVYYTLSENGNDIELTHLHEMYFVYTIEALTIRNLTKQTEIL